MRKVLVTGAGGFIGSHLTERLLSQGTKVRALVHYNSSNGWGWLEGLAAELKDNLEVISGDIRDPAGMRAALKGCDVVFHLAALIAIPYSYDYPQSYIETNVTGTLNILQAAKDLEIEKLVVTSTSEVYGSAQTAPITELHPLHPQSPYAASKVGADQIALSFHRSFNVPVAVMRPFNTFGPRQSARAVIPSTIVQLINGKKTIKLGSLEPTRDFMFVHDTADAFIAVAKCKESVGQVVQAGSGCEFSIGHTAKLIIELLGNKAEIECDEQRLRPALSEVSRLLASNEKISSMTSWKPQYAGLEGFKNGLQKTIDWFKRPENIGRYKADLYNV